MNNSSTSYAALVKPSWAPPSWVFGPVWTVLYVIIAISYGYVGYLFITKKLPFIVVLPFILNLIFNFLFTPLQFGLQNNVLAMIDIFLVLGTLVWALIGIYKYVPWVAYANIPYLVWVAFATTVQVAITIINR